MILEIETVRMIILLQIRLLLLFFIIFDENGKINNTWLSIFYSNAQDLCILGWFKNAFSSETDKIMLGTTFSHYLGIKQCRKPKIENFYTFFHPVQALQSFTK